MNTAVIFDLDGTLIDNAYFHTVAWSRACAECGVSANAASLHALGGMGSEQFVQALLGRDMPELAAAHDRHTKAFDPEIGIIPGAAELLGHLHDRGIGRILATSSGREAAAERARALCAGGPSMDLLVTQDDVKNTKPAPDLIAVALRRAGLTPSRVLMVGDARWDVEAAGRCGVQTIGVRTGGSTAIDSAGAICVYDSVNELLHDYEGSPLALLT